MKYSFRHLDLLHYKNRLALQKSSNKIQIMGKKRSRDLEAEEPPADGGADRMDEDSGDDEVRLKPTDRLRDHFPNIHRILIW